MVRLTLWKNTELMLSVTDLPKKKFLSGELFPHYAGKGSSRFLAQGCTVWEAHPLVENGGPEMSLVIPACVPIREITQLPTEWREINIWRDQKCQSGHSVELSSLGNMRNKDGSFPPTSIFFIYSGQPIYIAVQTLINSCLD